MAVYKIFPTQDTTLYSAYSTMNTGLDAILEVSNKLGLDENPEVARYLVQFDQNEISDIYFNKLSGSQYDIYLKNFIAEAQGLNQNTTLEILPLAQQWNNGTGYYLDNPKETDGASWKYSNYNGSGPWNLTGYYSGSTGAIYYTSSYSTTYGGVGGGNWFFNTSGGLYVVVNYVVPNYVANQFPYTGSASSSFGLRSTKDIEANVSTVVNNWLNNVIPNLKNYIVCSPRHKALQEYRLKNINCMAIATKTKIETLMKYGYTASDKKSLTTLMDKPYIDYKDYPLLDDVKSRVTDPAFSVEEVALAGWVVVHPQYPAPPMATTKTRLTINTLEGAFFMCQR